ncbi:MAG: hypothetical protein LBT09_06005 [Planctomycetaceae bacterium]|jgi:hypothetical protein|nr:hypothetical protein [Planctomycetaceae bacterium]
MNQENNEQQVVNHVVNVNVNVEQSQALPAIMAFFFSGIGQLIQGRASVGLLWLLTEWVIGGILIISSFGVGLIFTLPTHILCIVDAATYKPAAGSSFKFVIAGLIINGVGLLFVLLIYGALISSAAAQ